MWRERGKQLICTSWREERDWRPLGTGDCHDVEGILPVIMCLTGTESVPSER